MTKSNFDSNFYIFLCFGQSNMEGQGPIEEQDKTCPDRFQMMPAIQMPTENREMHKWYTATPPLCRSGSGIPPADYFGRHMVEKLPSNIKIGVINVAIEGSKIELFDEKKKNSISRGLQKTGRKK